MIDLPEFPTTGINIHCLTVANILQKRGVAQCEAPDAIMRHGQGLRRALKRNEVLRAVEKAYGSPLPDDPNWRPSGPPKKEAWQPVTTTKATIRNRVELADIWDASPIRCDEGLTQLDCLRLLFPDPDGLLCIGRSAFSFETKRLDEFQDLAGAQFIVPSYMSKPLGLTQDGKISAHTLDNTGPRLYCVCDFDDPSSEDHPTIIWELKQMAKLVLVLSSGGKSKHAWFSVPEARQVSFWKSAIRLGADPALMRNRSSFVRLPDGMRDNGNQQTVYYLDK